MNEVPPPLCLLIVATAPQAGKSVAAAHVAARMGLAPVSSSSIVAARVERAHGVAAGTIARDRRIDPEHWRPELIAEADAMRAGGVYPGVGCVEAGHRVIDGLRTAAEVRATRAAAIEAGWRPLVICITRPRRSPRRSVASRTARTQRRGAVRPWDNTDAVGLRAGADIRVRNDATVLVLRHRLDRILARHGVVLPA